MPAPTVTTGLVSQWLLDGDLTDNWSTNDASDGSTAVTYTADVPSALSGVITQSRSTGWASAPGSLLASNVCSLTFWGKVTTINTYSCGMGIYTSNGDSMEVFVNNSNSRYFGGNFSNQALSAISSIVINTWQHVALVSNGTTTQLYINGVASGTTGTTNFSTFTDNLWLCTRDNLPTFQYRGLVCDCRLYSLALSAANVAAIAAGDYGGGSSNGAAAYYYRHLLGA